MALSTLSQICEALEDRAYNCRIVGDAVVVMFGSDAAPFPVVLTVNGKNELVVTCQLAELGDIDEEKATEFAFSALDINSRISPYAVAIITSGDDPELAEADFPIILQDNIPLGDLCEEELESAMQSLSAAIVGCHDLLAGFLSEPEPEAAAAETEAKEPVACTA
jgi:hypothetical protein